MEPLKTDLVVIGAGPGGYVAAFAAADQNKKVVLIDNGKRLGGICLNQGCIPSKALLHATHLLSATKEAHLFGLQFEPPRVDLAKMLGWKDSILEKLHQGIHGLAQKRGIQVLQGKASFENSQALKVETSSGIQTVQFNKAIVATGSTPIIPKAFDLQHPRIMTSTDALNLPDIPKDLLVVGGGYIGMELGIVYASLGSRVVIAEAMDSILLGIDSDLMRPVLRSAEKKFREVRVKTKVSSMKPDGDRVRVTMSVDGKDLEESYDRVLIAVGRSPNTDGLSLEKTRATRNEKGFIQVNEKQQTTDENIFAIGDAAGGVLLAHKASREARVAVSAITGKASSEKKTIPAVIFTEPEVAWCGLTEAEAKNKGLTVKVARFPWAASGRALTMDHPDGLTKLIIDPTTEKILGVGIVGYGAGELIAEGVLAMEMGATAHDLAKTIHPHPTLSETLMECAEVFYGQSPHVFVRRAK